MKLGHGFAHLFSIDGQDFLHDVHSGCAIQLRPVDRAVLEHLERGLTDDQEMVAVLGPRFGEQLCRASLAEVRVQIESGNIFGPPPDFTSMREAMTRQLLPRLRARQVDPARQVDVFVSADCNLRCGYCWNKQGNFGAQAGLMDAATGRAVIDFLAGQGPAPVDILLFGGEPLLDLGFLEGFLGYATQVSQRAGKPFRYAVNTNGTLLDDARIDLIRRHRIAVSVSFDGPAEVQDRNRPTRSGRSSYQMVRAGLERYAAALGAMPAVRVTQSRFSRPWVETFEFLRGLGVTQINTAWSSGNDVLDPAFLWSAEERSTTALADLERFCGFYLDYLCRLPEGSEPCVEGALLGSLERACKGLRCQNCNMHTGFGLAFATDGSIYPCVEALGRPYMRMGSVHSGVEDTSAMQAAAERFVDDLPECHDCWLKYLCAGHCFIESHRFEHGAYVSAVQQRECETQRRTYQLTLSFMASLMERAPALFDRTFGQLTGRRQC